MTKTVSLFSKRYDRFRRMLIEAREKANLTQEELAFKLKTHQPFISRYESGERRLDVIEFIDIARALNINPADFINKLDRR